MKKQKYYYVYKITNKINEKTYIGCHETHNLDDGYMGSGTLIRKAISKYGVENFVKNILSLHENREDMYRTERVVIDAEKPAYNLNIGGRGGFHYLNSNGMNTSPLRLKSMKVVGARNHEKAITRYYNNPLICKTCEEPIPYEKRFSAKKFCGHSCAAKYTNSGRKHSEATRLKISNSRKYKNPYGLVA